MSTTSEEAENELLPKAPFWGQTTHLLSQYEGFWFHSPFIKAIFNVRSNFVARDDDVILASSMKTGTTWLKALCFSIVQRDWTIEVGNPHSHVPTLEAAPYSLNADDPRINALLYDNAAEAPTSPPRLLHTHLPYSLLPGSMRDSACKMVYLARDPKDTLVSMWHFFNSAYGRVPLEEAFHWFCSGRVPFGPFFEHVAEYWEESKARPEKVLFVKYEELKREPEAQVSRIARFLGKPLGDEREAGEIVRRCSFERLKNLEVNKSGSYFLMVPNKAFFRKAEIGDWNNHLSREMEEKMNQLSFAKFAPIGLSL